MIDEGALTLPRTDPRLRTTIELSIQADVTRLARRHVAEWRPAGAEQAAVMVVKRTAGEVLAAAGSTDYRDRRSGAIDFSVAFRYVFFAGAALMLVSFAFFAMTKEQGLRTTPPPRA